MLDANGVAYRINPRLVRGMDYYNLTVFEFDRPTTWARRERFAAAAATTDLIEQIGGKTAPAVGLGLGHRASCCC